MVVCVYCLFVCLCARVFACKLVGRLVCLLVGLLAGWFACWLVCLLVDWFVGLSCSMGPPQNDFAILKTASPFFTPVPPFSSKPLPAWQVLRRAAGLGASGWRGRGLVRPQVAAQVPSSTSFQKKLTDILMPCVYP